MTFRYIFVSIFDMKDMEPTLRDISRRIQTRRKGMEMTQAELAKRLGKSRAYVINLENGGDVQPTVSVMYDLTEIFGCTILDLMPREKLSEVPPELRGTPVSRESEDLIASLLRSAKGEA